MSFKENLKSELAFTDILVKELSAATGISRHTLDNYLNEREHMPTAENAVKIAQALGVTVEYLILGKMKKQDDPLLSAEIKTLVQSYKQLNERDRKMIREIIKLYKNQGSSA